MNRVFRWADVHHMDYDFEVRGDWEPLEGGFFYEYEILHCGDDMVELLSQKVQDEIVLKAEEKLNAMDRGEL